MEGSFFNPFKLGYLLESTCEEILQFLEQSLNITILV